MNILFHETPNQYQVEYQRLRSILVERGTSLNEWCAQQNINRQLAYRALKGQSFGRQAVELRARILREFFDKAA
jgi:predicted transcriptional regulator